MASITIYVPDQDPLEIELDDKEQVSIGRGPDNDVVLDHVSLSGSHAVVRNQDGSIQVEDVGSTNGTYVNGNQVPEAVLSHGDRVAFGAVEAVFSDEAAAEEAGEVAEPAGSTSYGTHHAELAEVSNRPAGYKNLSPIEKVEKKDSLAQVAILIGIVAILAGLAVAGVATTMSAG